MRTVLYSWSSRVRRCRYCVRPCETKSGSSAWSASIVKQRRRRLSSRENDAPHLTFENGGVMPTKYVLIGNSAASLAAIDGIRKHDKQGEITLINREDGPAYSRVALPYYVAGEMTLDELLIRQKTDYTKIGVTLVEKERVVAIHPTAKQVELESGKRVTYDKLFIGTGSETIVPPIQG